MTTEDPFDGREYDGRVFHTRQERLFFIGKLSPRQRKEWLQNHPDRWQTREDFLRDRQARTGNNVQAKPTEPSSTASATAVPTGGESDAPFPVPGEDTRQSDEAATNSAPPTIDNRDATATAGDEIVINERRFIGERRVAAMLGISLRTLQRWRKEGKGPRSTKIGRKPFYELDELQKWIDTEKSR